MVTVVRVQDASGRGPWRPGLSSQWIDGDAPVDRLCETVMDLIPVATLRSLPADRAYGCACRTVDGVMAWFTAVERVRLAGMGFHIVRLRVDQVLAESPWQVVVARRRPFRDGATRLRWP